MNALVSFTLLWENTWDKHFTRGKGLFGLQSQRFQLVVSWLIAFGPVMRHDMVESAWRQRTVHLLAVRKQRGRGQGPNSCSLA